MDFEFPVGPETLWVAYGGCPGEAYVVFAKSFPEAAEKLRAFVTPEDSLHVIPVRHSDEHLISPGGAYSFMPPDSQTVKDWRQALAAAKKESE